MAPQGCPLLGAHGPALAEVPGADKAEHSSPADTCSQPHSDGLHLRVLRNVPPQVLGKL